MLPYMLLSLFALRQAPIGTELHVRLVTPVGSYATRAGNPLSAVLIAPVTVQDQTILPQGSVLSGSVQRVVKIGFGIVHETATLALNFNEVTLPNGEMFPLCTRLTDVDNSRERVIPDGSIRGVRSTASIAYRFSGYIRTALLWEVHAPLALWAIKTLLIQVPEPEIYYPSGVELTLTLSEPMYAQPQPGSAEPAGRLSEKARDVLEPMVGDMPIRTRSQNSNREADLINLMFIGSRREDFASVHCRRMDAGYDGVHAIAFSGAAGDRRRPGLSRRTDVDVAGEPRTARHVLAKGPEQHGQAPSHPYLEAGGDLER